MPSVTLLGTSSVAALYESGEQFSLTISEDKGKTWDPPTTIAESNDFDHAIIGSGSDLYMFFVNDTIAAYRKLSTSSTPQKLPFPFSRQAVDALTGNWHSTQLLGYTACGAKCVAILFGVLEDLPGGYKQYTISFSYTTTSGLGWNTTVVETWSKRTSYDLISLTAGDLAYADGTFIIGMSSRSSPTDTIHSDAWRESDNFGRSWRSFTGWSGFLRARDSASDIQIVPSGAKGSWAAVITLLSSHKPLLVHGKNGDAEWTSGIVPASFGSVAEGFKNNFFFLAQFHQGLIGLYAHETNLAIQISLTSGDTWGGHRDVTTLDEGSGKWEHNFPRRGSFALPRGILTLNSSGTVYLLSLDDCGDNSIGITTDSIPYSCCPSTGCPVSPSPTPLTPRPPTTPTSTPTSTPVRPPPSFLETIGLTVPQLAIGAAGIFLAIALVMAIVSIVLRRYRRRGGHTTLIVNDLDTSQDESL